MSGHGSSVSAIADIITTTARAVAMEQQRAGARLARESAVEQRAQTDRAILHAVTAVAPAVTREQSDVIERAIDAIATRLHNVGVEHRHTVEVTSPAPQVTVAPEVRAIVEIGKLDIPPAHVDVVVRLDSLREVLDEVCAAMVELLAIARAPRRIELRDAAGEVVRTGKIMIEVG